MHNKETFCGRGFKKTKENIFFPIVMKLNSKEYTTARIPF